MPELPDFIEGYGRVRPFTGAPDVPVSVSRAATRWRPVTRDHEKLLDTLDAAFDACGVRDGATLSFHYQLRNGDQVLNQVIDAAARRGLRGLRIAVSSIFPVHAPLVEHLSRGVVDRITTAYMSGPAAAAVSRGLLPRSAWVRCRTACRWRSRPSWRSGPERHRVQVVAGAWNVLEKSQLSLARSMTVVSRRLRPSSRRRAT